MINFLKSILCVLSKLNMTGFSVSSVDCCLEESGLDLGPGTGLVPGRVVFSMLDSVLSSSLSSPRRKVESKIFIF